MKKDFSQDFEHESLTAYLLVRNKDTKKFLLYSPTLDYEAGFYSHLSMQFDAKRQISIQIAAYLYKLGLVLAGYRELAREDSVLFSFVDETPGFETTTICFVVDADIDDEDKLQEPDNTILFVDAEEMLAKLLEGPYCSAVTKLGLAKLITEEAVLKK